MSVAKARIEAEGPESTILEAARRVFHRQGMAGARMQEIAAEAGLNQALLHYYFRSKDKLFSAVFQQDVRRLLQLQARIFEEQDDVFELIARFVAVQIEFLQKHPYLPGFVLGEWGRCPEHHAEEELELRKELNQQFRQLLKKARQEGRIRPIDPVQLMVNMLSLCMHPFIAKPLIMSTQGMDEAAFERFIERRKSEVSAFILSSLRPESEISVADLKSPTKPARSPAAFPPKKTKK